MVEVEGIFGDTMLQQIQYNKFLQKEIFIGKRCTALNNGV